MNLETFSRHALTTYDLSAITALDLVNISENATFKVQCADGSRYALRIHRQGYHSTAAIQSELAWLNALRNDGIVTTASPIVASGGETLQLITHQGTTRHVVLFEWLKGTTPEISDDLTAHFETLGQIAARMHKHAKAWVRPKNFKRFTWDFETSLGEQNPHWGRWSNGIGVTPEHIKLFARAVSKVQTRLNAYGKSPERFGLIHGDLRLENLLIDGPKVKVIDFDDMGFGWFMYDAAATISFHEHEPQAENLIEAWKQGYRRATELKAADEAEIPTFIMLRRLLLVAWIGSHHETKLATALGAPYTDQTMELCERYLNAY